MNVSRTGENTEFLRSLIAEIAVGKKGSRSLDAATAAEVLNRFDQSDVTVKAVFLTAMRMKGLADEELSLSSLLPEAAWNQEEDFIHALLPVISPEHRDLLTDLLKPERDTATAPEALARMLFDATAPEPVKAIATTVLRMRYATVAEYAACYRAISNTFSSAWKNLRFALPAVQIAEPFDGVDHSEILSPVLATYLFKRGFQPVFLGGRSSGPKHGSNLRKLAETLEKMSPGTLPRLSDPASPPAPGRCGYFLDAEDTSPLISSWIDLRRKLVKRPFLATLEKYLNPLGADILFASAFHGPFGDRMLEIAEALGWRGAVVVRKGREGALTFSLSKPVEIHVTALTGEKYLRRSFNVSAAESAGGEAPDGREPADADRDARQIISFLEGKPTEDKTAKRITLAEIALGRSLDFISSVWSGTLRE